MPKPGVVDGLAGNGAFRLDEHFDHVFTRIRSCLLQCRAALRQQPSAESQQIDDARQRCDGANRERREHLQWRQPRLQHQAGDDQIGAGAYQSAHAAEDGRVVHRHQQTRRRDAAAPAPALDRRSQHRHDRRVVDEGAKRCGDTQCAYLRLEGSTRPAEHPVADPADRSGGLERSHQHEQQGHGQHARIPEAAQRLGWRQHAAGHQHDRGTGEDLVGADPFPQQ